MLEFRKSDAIWSWALVGLNILSLLLGLIPGMIKMYDKEVHDFVNGCLLKVPSGNIMKNVAPLLIVAFAYSLLTCFIYLKGQSIGQIRGILVLSVACGVLSLLPLLPPGIILKMPYSVIPCIWGVQSVAAFIRMKGVQKRLDEFEED